MSTVQYNARVDAVVYGAAITADFTAQDWLDLAMAALDQAGVRVSVQNEIREMTAIEGEEAAE